jgi:hypothetical protein
MVGGGGPPISSASLLRAFAGTLPTDTLSSDAPRFASLPADAAMLPADALSSDAPRFASLPADAELLPVEAAAAALAPLPTSATAATDEGALALRAVGRASGSLRRIAAVRWPEGSVCMGTAAAGRGLAAAAAAARGVAAAAAAPAEVPSSPCSNFSVDGCMIDPKYSFGGVVGRT